MKFRPKLDIKEFECAVNQAVLADIENEMLEYVRYSGVFDELTLKKSLSLPSKPPAIYLLSKLCEKIGALIPKTFDEFMDWSADQSADNISWHGNFICSIAYTCDGLRLEPEQGTALYHTFSIHKELFNGLDY